MGANCTVEQEKDGKVVIKAEADPHALTSACSNMTIAEKDSKGMTNHRLLVAARDNDIDGIRKSLEEGAYLETRRPFVMRPKPPPAGSDGSGKKRKSPKEGLTPLMYAAQNGSMEAARLLLDARAQIAARDEEGVQPLHLAAATASHDVCALLLNSGADREAADDEGRKAIDHVPETELAAKADRTKWENLLGASKLPVAPRAAALQASGTTDPPAATAAPATDTFQQEAAPVVEVPVVTSNLLDVGDEPPWQVGPWQTPEEATAEATGGA